MEDMGPRGAWSCHLSSRKENKPALLSGVKTIRSPKAQPTSPQATSLFLPFANKGHSRPTKSPKYERCSICLICFWLSCFGSYFTVLVVNFLFWSSGIYVIIHSCMCSVIPQVFMDHPLSSEHWGSEIKSDTVPGFPELTPSWREPANIDDPLCSVLNKCQSGSPEELWGRGCSVLSGRS